TTISYHLLGCDVTATLVVGKTGACEKPAPNENNQTQSQNNELTISPNPTHNDIVIAYPCKSSGKLDIMLKDIAGRIVFADKINCEKGNTIERSVNLNSLNDGVYFVEMTLNDQHVVKKIVKL